MSKSKKSWLHTGGQIIILNTLFFLGISIILIAGVAEPVVSHISSSQSIVSSKLSFLASQSAMQEAYYRLKTGKNLGSSQMITFASSSALITVVTTSTGKNITVNGTSSDYRRDLQLNLLFGTGVSFHYGVQSGQGGFVMQNSSTITGNIFSGGSVLGSGNTVFGDVISAGSTGCISGNSASNISGCLNGINVTGTAFAHTIWNSSVSGDAYYSTDKSGTTVSGISHPNSTDQVTSPLPLSDAQITAWENEAQTNNTVNCSGTYQIKNTTVLLNATKYTCDLDIKNSTVTLNGPIWATGNITVETGSVVQISPSQGIKSVPMIADNPSNQSGSGIIDTQNGSTFLGSGSPGSFVFMISQNNSAETGGSVDAVLMSQGSSAMVAYAGHGLITLAQTVNIKEATAYKILLKNSANVTYDSGLPSVLFSAGPGGGYDIQSWTEI